MLLESKNFAFFGCEEVKSLLRNCFAFFNTGCFLGVKKRMLIFPANSIDENTPQEI